MVFKEFKDLADKKKHVIDEDLEAIVTEGILRTADIFKLEYQHVISGTSVLPMASVKLSINAGPFRGRIMETAPSMWSITPFRV